MLDTESVEGILYYAIGREVEANVFYNLLSQYVDDPQIQAICADLALEELRHKARLELEIMKLGKVAKQFISSDKDEEFLPKPLDCMLNMVKVMQMDLPQLLLFAMKKEKIAFRFYIDFLPKVQDARCREVLIELAEEEARHKIRFELEYDRLMTAGSEPLV
ncbi:MAG: ferritin family protein [Sedimentisphaerales bacterium]|nr:ferritin family protein [Sedimentisphaerales bacterium]